MTLPENALKLFLLYAKDAGNWSGTPLVNGNVTLLSEARDRGLLTHLKTAGLISTFSETERINGRICTNAWVTFEEPGIALAAEHGIDLSPYRI